MDNAVLNACLCLSLDEITLEVVDGFGQCSESLIWVIDYILSTLGGEFPGIWYRPYTHTV